MSDIVKFVSNSDLSKLKDAGLGDEAINNFKDYMFQRGFAKDTENSATPFDVVEEREGFKDKQGNPTILEYVPEEYCIGELNRLFPGWWTEDMKRSTHEEVVAFQTIVVEGYLCVSYPLPSGRIAVEKRWGIADNDVKFLSGTKTPVDIGNNFKGAKTEWIRNACKWYGIGLDIYHQHITSDMRRVFEDLIRSWKQYADYWIKLASTRVTGKDFRDMLRAMPRSSQVRRMEIAMECFPVSEDRDKLWKSFGTHSNAPAEKAQKFEEFLTKIEQIAQKLKTNKE